MNVNIDIPEEKIINALISACENGSYYWAKTSDYPYKRCKLAGSCGEDYHLSLPITVTEHFDGEKPEQDHSLSLTGLQTGIKRMASEYPKHFADLLNGGDWITGDVLLQLSTLGELKYG